MPRHEVDQAVQLDYEVKVAGVLTDATVTLTVIKPDGTTLTPAPVVTRITNGTYRGSFDPDVPGTWRYRWKATGGADTFTSGYVVVYDPAGLLPLIEVEEVEDRMQTTFDDTEVDGVLSVIRGVSARVRRYTRQDISKRTTTDTFYVYGDEGLVLPQRPVNSITSVTIDGVAGVLGTTYAVVGDGALVPVTLSTWGDVATPAKIVVTYDHGSDPVPEDIADLVTNRVIAQLANPENVRQIATGSFSATFAGETIRGSGWTAEEKEVLDGYRQRSALYSLTMVTT